MAYRLACVWPRMVHFCFDYVLRAFKWPSTVARFKVRLTVCWAVSKLPTDVELVPRVPLGRRFNLYDSCSQLRSSPKLKLTTTFSPGPVARYGEATPENKFKAKSDGRYAEVWMGTSHEHGPSSVIHSDGSLQPLKDFILKDPKAVYGKSIGRLTETAQKDGQVRLAAVLHYSSSSSSQAHDMAWP